MDKVIKEGDVVSLKSNLGIKMTVEQLNPQNNGVVFAKCIWFNGLVIESCVFNVTSLVANP